jgi:inorganic pyrophosphatase
MRNFDRGRGGDRLLAHVEIPKGGRNKYEYDEGLGEIVLDRFLSSSTVYPTGCGFLPGRRGEDGDPLDCLICVSGPTFPGCIVPVHPVALFKMTDEAGVDDKVVCVPRGDPAWSGIQRLDDLPETFRREVEHFFSVYKDLEDKVVEVGGRRDRHEAEEVIAAAAARERER